jgi:hypothetical protein
MRREMIPALKDCLSTAAAALQVNGVAELNMATLELDDPSLPMAVAVAALSYRRAWRTLATADPVYDEFLCKRGRGGDQWPRELDNEILLLAQIDDKIDALSCPAGPATCEVYHGLAAGRSPIEVAEVAGGGWPPLVREAFIREIWTPDILGVVCASLRAAQVSNG